MHAHGFFFCPGDDRMLKRICPICGRIHNQGERCPMAKRRHKEYDRDHRDRARAVFYHSKEWTALHDMVKDRFHGMDAYEWCVNHCIVPGTIVHHIIPLAEDPEGCADLDNLILLSAKTHKMVHDQYRSGHKQEMQAKLFEILRKFE